MKQNSVNKKYVNSVDCYNVVYNCVAVIVRTMTKAITVLILSSCYFITLNFDIPQSFSALTLLLRWQEEHPVHKEFSDELPVWLSVWSEVQMICMWSN